MWNSEFVTLVSRCYYFFFIDILLCPKTCKFLSIKVLIFVLVFIIFVHYYTNNFRDALTQVRFMFFKVIVNDLYIYWLILTEYFNSDTRAKRVVYFNPIISLERFTLLSLEEILLCFCEMKIKHQMFHQFSTYFYFCSYLRKNKNY